MMNDGTGPYCVLSLHKLRSCWTLGFLLFRIGQNVVHFGFNLKFKPTDNV